MGVEGCHIAARAAIPHADVAILAAAPHVVLPDGAQRADTLRVAGQGHAAALVARAVPIRRLVGCRTVGVLPHAYDLIGASSPHESRVGLQSGGRRRVEHEQRLDERVVVAARRELLAHEAPLPHLEVGAAGVHGVLPRAHARDAAVVRSPALDDLCGVCREHVQVAVRAPDPHLSPAYGGHAVRHSGALPELRVRALVRAEPAHAALAVRAKHPPAARVMARRLECRV